MISNWIIAVLSAAYEFFNGKIQVLFELLMLDPKTYMDGALWEFTQNVFSLLLGSGYSLMTICIYVELVRGSYESMIQRKPETIIWIFLVTSVMGGIMAASQELLLIVFKIGQGFAGKILGASGSSIITLTWEIPDRIINATNGLSTILSLVVFILCLLGACVVIFSSFSILMVGYGRVFNIYLHLSIAPIPVAFLGSGITRPFFMNYLKSFLIVSLQGLLIILACALFSVFSKGYVLDIVDQTTSNVEETVDDELTEEEAEEVVKDGLEEVTGSIGFDESGDESVKVVASYLIEQAFLFLLLSGIIKASDTAVNKIFGVG